MKKQAYVVQRVTLMPSGDQVWAQMAAIKRGGEQVVGTIDVFFAADEAPTAGTKFIVTVEKETA